jgi:hypothetical protein
LLLPLPVTGGMQGIGCSRHSRKSRQTKEIFI